MTKLVVTHLGALRRKYGGTGRARVRAALRELTAADAARGVRTRLVAVDDGRTARALGVADVDDATDAPAVKALVDAAVARWAPEYVVLLGSPDVVPMQALTNPLWTGDPRRGDPDADIPSDLPYACDVPHSADPGRFRGATRVVGRVPDGTGAGDPAQLLRLLAVAAAYRVRPRADYLPPFVLSAAQWHGSTASTLSRLVGDAAELHDVPPDLPPWTAAQTRRRTHFVNLHGGPADPQYYGQQGRSYPVALHARDLARGGSLVEGTVGAAECCYGGMLYDPAEAGGVPGFVDTYLSAGAYGYCASTNTAYGPAEGNDAADLICRAFLQHALGGASLGRAMLQARQDYVFTKASLSPMDLKTLAQFALFGDPSVHCVARPAADPVEGAVAAQPKSGRKAAPGAPPEGIAGRRRRLQANGQALESTTTRAEASPRDTSLRERRRLATELATRAPGRRPSAAQVRAAAASPDQVLTFDVVDAPAAPSGPGERFHVLLDRGTTGLQAVVAREEAGRLQRPTVLRAR